MKKGGFLKEAILLVGVLVLSVSYVLAAGSSTPLGPDTITVSESGRNTKNGSAVTIPAEAGNVTALVIDDIRITESWQGYYGNITGTITLDDANNFTMYDWSLPNPKGEVYASNGSNVNWGSVYCINVSQEGQNPVRPDGSVSNINGSQIELNFGINETDVDGLNETFNDTYTDTVGFRVGSITIDVEDGCSLAHPFANEGHNTDWNELLLSDNNTLIFTALIRENADGYQPGSTDLYDFQMLVLENGHTGSETTTTNYYFYVELA
jgi:hypothetical protein